MAEVSSYFKSSELGNNYLLIPLIMSGLVFINKWFVWRGCSFCLNYFTIDSKVDLAYNLHRVETLHY